MNQWPIPDPFQHGTGREGMGSLGKVHPFKPPQHLQQLAHIDCVVPDATGNVLYHPPVNNQNRNAMLRALEAVLVSHNASDIDKRLWDLTRHIGTNEIQAAANFADQNQNIDFYGSDFYMLADNGRTLEQRLTHATLEAMSHVQLQLDQPCIDGEVKQAMEQGAMGYQNRQVTENQTLYGIYDRLIEHCSQVLDFAFDNDVLDPTEIMEVPPTGMLVDAVGGEAALSAMALMIMPHVIARLDQPPNPANAANAQGPDPLNQCFKCGQNGGLMATMWQHLCDHLKCNNDLCAYEKYQKSSYSELTYVTAPNEPILATNAPFTFVNKHAQLRCRLLPVFFNLINRFKYANARHLTASEVKHIRYFNKLILFAPRHQAFRIGTNRHNWIFADALTEIICEGGLDSTAINRLLKACAAHDLVYDYQDLSKVSREFGDHHARDRLEFERAFKICFGQGSLSLTPQEQLGNVGRPRLYRRQGGLNMALNHNGFRECLQSSEIVVGTLCVVPNPPPTLAYAGAAGGPVFWDDDYHPEPGAAAEQHPHHPENMHPINDESACFQFHSLSINMAKSEDVEVVRKSVKALPRTHWIHPKIDGVRINRFCRPTYVWTYVDAGNVRRDGVSPRASRFRNSGFLQEMSHARGLAIDVALILLTRLAHFENDQMVMNWRAWDVFPRFCVRMETVATGWTYFEGFLRNFMWFLQSKQGLQFPKAIRDEQGRNFLLRMYGHASSMEFRKNMMSALLVAERRQDDTHTEIYQLLPESNVPLNMPTFNFGFIRQCMTYATKHAANRQPNGFIHINASIRFAQNDPIVPLGARTQATIRTQLMRGLLRSVRRRLNAEVHLNDVANIALPGPDEPIGGVERANLQRFLGRRTLANAVHQKVQPHQSVRMFPNPWSTLLTTNAARIFRHASTREEDHIPVGLPLFAGGMNQVIANAPHPANLPLEDQAPPLPPLNRRLLAFLELVQTPQEQLQETGIIEIVARMGVAGPERAVLLPLNKVDNLELVDPLPEVLDMQILNHNEVSVRSRVVLFEDLVDTPFRSKTFIPANLEGMQVELMPIWA